jgi:phage head maturation protease
METKKISEKPEIISEYEVMLKIAAFGVEDDVFDVMLPTAFNRSIKNNFKDIKHVIEHKHDFEYIIGYPKEFEVKADGLWVNTLFNPKEINSEQAYQKYVFFAKNNMNIGQSTGFETIQKMDIPERKAKVRQKFGQYYDILPSLREKSGRDLIELKLGEYSSVFKQANPEANKFILKAGFDLEEYIRLELTSEMITADKIDSLKTALMHFEGTQEIDPQSNPQTVENVDLKSFATILINTISNTKLF